MKARHIALWVVQVLTALAFLGASAGKLSANPQMVENFARWGHGLGFLYFIGACEGLGGLGLLIPRTRFWAALGLVPIMLGAIQTHLSHGETKMAAAPVILLVLLGITAVARRDEARNLFANGPLLTGKPA